MSRCERVGIDRQLTFTMDPKQGARSRSFPFRERVAINEPGPGVAVPRFPCDIVNFPWIGRRKPMVNIIP
jgi:hypothetical protein